MSEPKPLKKKPQPRSERTRNAILEAAAALLVECGTEAVSMTSIAKKAGVAVGTVYIHFQDKTALIRAFLERMVSDFEAMILREADFTIWEDQSVLSVVAGYVDFMQITAKEQTSRQTAVCHLLADHADLQTRIRELRAGGRQAVVDLLLSKRGRIGHPDPSHAVPFLIDQLGSMMHSRTDMIYQTYAVSNAPDAVFRCEALAIAKGYLQLEDDPADPDLSGGYGAQPKDAPPATPSDQ